MALFEKERMRVVHIKEPAVITLDYEIKTGAGDVTTDKETVQDLFDQLWTMGFRHTGSTQPVASEKPTLGELQINSFHVDAPPEGSVNVRLTLSWKGWNKLLSMTKDGKSQLPELCMDKKPRLKG